MSRRERQTYRMAARDFSGPAVEEQPTAAEAKILSASVYLSHSQCLILLRSLWIAN